MLELKRCYRCGLSKPHTEFSRDASKLDGLTTRCTPCNQAYCKGYYIKNREKELKRGKLVKTTRYASDWGYRLMVLTRGRIYNALKQGFTKSATTKEILGCSIPYYRTQYLEPLFYPHPETGEMMTWDNYGLWHIDHKVPVSFFDLRNPAEQKAAFHYVNTRPMWKEHNLERGNNINYQVPGL